MLRMTSCSYYAAYSATLYCWCHPETDSMCNNTIEESRVFIYFVLIFIIIIYSFYLFLVVHCSLFVVHFHYPKSFFTVFITIPGTTLNEYSFSNLSVNLCASFPNGPILTTGRFNSCISFKGKL